MGFDHHTKVSKKLMIQFQENPQRERRTEGQTEGQKEGQIDPIS